MSAAQPPLEPPAPPMPAPSSLLGADDKDDQPIISLSGVTKAFGTHVVYTDVSLDIRRGETLTVIGGSGTGKSVMLKMLIGLLEPDAGEILFDGRSIIGLKDSEFLSIRRRISMLFQSAALFDSISVGENIAFPLREMGMDDEEELAEIVQQKLALVGLEPQVANLAPVELSGGMRKRVGLARAIATEPSVILYDEPTTGLDPVNTSRISRLILHLQKKLQVTSVVVTHEMRLAFMVSNRIAMLHDGRILTVDTPAAIQASADPILRGFVHGDFPEEDAGSS